MDGLGQGRGWVLALVVVVASAAVGLIGYNIGVSHGLAQTGADPQFYGWHRPWGFGFMFPLLFVFAWFALFRGLWWGWGGPWARRHRYYYPGPGPNPMFEEWHRRAHERMKEQPPADDSGRRG